MALTISLIAVTISIVSMGYGVWRDSQETADAGTAWRAKRRLEEALVTHLRTLKAELRIQAGIPNGLMTGRFLRRATQDLAQALDDGRAAGLPRVLLHQSQRKNAATHEDLLTEWTMLEEHVVGDIARLDRAAEMGGEVELDPNQAVLILGGAMLRHLVPLTRRKIRRFIRQPIELSLVEEQMYRELDLAATEYI